MKKEALSHSHKFKLWKSNLINKGLSIHEIKEIHTRHRHNGEALFGLVLLDATTPEGDKIPPICFIKGQVVCVLICLIDKETQEKFLLLVKQRRICNGGFIYEQVAGMVDGEDQPLEVAVKEVQEETGVKVLPAQLHLLNTEPFFPSTGTSDESMWFYCCELEMSGTEIQSLDNQKMGIESEHERILTHIATIPESKKLITNTNGLLNIYLYEDWVRSKGNG